MSPRNKRLVILAAVALALLALPTAALASAGGGSAGYSGGGGGGGGHGSGFAIYIIIDLLIHIAVLGHGLGAVVLIALGLTWWAFTRGGPKVSEWWANRAADRSTHRSQHGKPSARERRVELAAAEAAEDDPTYAPDAVRASAAELFKQVQTAWDSQDENALNRLVGPDLFVEWRRRLADFDRRGWSNRVEIIGEPQIEYVGLHHTGDAATDHVVVRIDARLKDYVVDRFGRHLKRTGRLGETTRIREYWTLQQDHGCWVVTSIEMGKEGNHQLTDEIVASAWTDERRMKDAALVEGAVAEAVPDTVQIAEVADLQYEGDAHAAAMDLSVADGRFAPDVLEVASRRAVTGWAQAVDGDDGPLRAVATTAAVNDLLYGGDTSRHTRLVVRGPQVKRIRIVALDAAAHPPAMTVEVDLSGRRYVENRDTTAVLGGSRTRTTSFTERWTLSLTDDAAQPWRITAVAAPVGLI